MPIKMSVIDIPISDDKFRRFEALFSQYQERLEKTPGVWKQVDRQFRQTTAAMLAQQQVMHEFSGTEKLKTAEKVWRGIASASSTVFGNTLRITSQLLKWGSLIGGGLLGGSLFGIDRMARDMASSRYAYTGLGMSYGGWRSFGINMNRFVDPGSFLSSINQAISNPALQGPLYAMGVNPNGSTEQVSLSMLRAMRRLAINTPRGELGIMSQAYGLQPFGGLETLMRLQQIPAEEFYRQMRREQNDKNALGLPPGVAAKWTDFTRQMDLAKSTIFKTFVVGLAPLEKPLERLSVAFSGFISKVMTGPEIKKGIDALATWLNTFSVEMTSKKFQDAVSSLVSDTGAIAQAFHWLAKEVRIYSGWAHPGHEIWDFAKGIWQGYATGGVGGNGLPMLAAGGVGIGSRSAMIGGEGRFGAAADKLDAIFGLPAGTMRRLVRTESGFNPNLTSGKGAMGLTQLMPDTAWQYGLRGNMAMDPMQNLVVGAEYLASLVRRYQGNTQEALAAYNWGPGNVDALMRKYGGAWRAHLPKSVSAYVTAISPDSNIVVTARHSTGANPALAAAGLAGVPQ